MFEQYEPLWLEEPLRPDDLRGYARLSGSVAMNIAAGEQESSADGFDRLRDEGRIDVIQIDVTRVGLTEAIRVARAAADRGLRVCNHNVTTGINTAASAHFLRPLPPCDPQRWMVEHCVEDGVLVRARRGRAADHRGPDPALRCPWIRGGPQRRGRHHMPCDRMSRPGRARRAR